MLITASLLIFTLMLLSSSSTEICVLHVISLPHSSSGGKCRTGALSYHVPLPVVDGFSPAGDLERVLVFELDLDATASEPQHEPRVLGGLGIQHNPLWVESSEVKLCCKPNRPNRSYCLGFRVVSIFKKLLKTKLFREHHSFFLSLIHPLPLLLCLHC